MKKKPPKPEEKQSIKDILDALDGDKDAQITADVETIEEALDIWVEQDSSESS